MTYAPFLMNEDTRHQIRALIESLTNQGDVTDAAALRSLLDWNSRAAAWIQRWRWESVNLEDEEGEPVTLLLCRECGQPKGAHPRPCAAEMTIQMLEWHP